MSSDDAPVWTPSVAARLAFLRTEMARLNGDQLQLSVMESPTTCFLGLDSSGASWLGIVCDPKSVSTDDRAAAVQFKIRPDGYRIIVAPATPEPVLVHYFEEVIELVRTGMSAGDAGAQALQNWRELLARPPGAPLSDETLAGLFGELEVLEMLLQHGGTLDHWTGWNRDHCDFRLPGLVIEVKSTTSANYRRVKIHGLNQLADPMDGSDLILVLRRLESSAAGRSVPDLVEALVALGVSRAKLLDRLHEARYSEAHRAAYQDTRFVSLEVALRRVDSGHPRLVPSMLEAVDLSAIDKIDYELNLNNDAEADLETNLEALVAEHLSS
jgi:hypothetical protein